VQDFPESRVGGAQVDLGCDCNRRWRVGSGAQRRLGRLQAPAAVCCGWVSGTFLRRPNNACQLFRQLFWVNWPEEVYVEGLTRIKFIVRCADDEPQDFGVRVIEDLAQ